MHTKKPFYVLVAFHVLSCLPCSSALQYWVPSSQEYRLLQHAFGRLLTLEKHVLAAQSKIFDSNLYSRYTDVLGEAAFLKSTFLTSTNGCAVDYCVRRTPNLAFLQKLQCMLPTPASLKRTDGRAVADQIRCRLQFT